MDLFTHVVLGATIGGFVAANKIGNKALWLGAICGIIPDVDMFFTLLYETTKGLFIHRGITHSFVFIICFSPILGYILRKFNKKTNFTIAQWTNFSFWILLTHIILDVFTVYGTGLLEPFNSKRFALSSLAFIDFFFTIPLLIIVAIALKVKQLRHKSIVTWFGIFTAVLYISFTILNKLYVQSEFEKKLFEQDITFNRTEIFPVAGSNFLWNCVAQDRDGFWMCYETNFSKHFFELDLYMRNDYEVFDIEDDERFKRLQEFTKGYYIIEKDFSNNLYLRDLRFGRVGLKKNDPFLMSFQLFVTHEKLVKVEKLHPSIKRLFSPQN